MNCRRCGPWSARRGSVLSVAATMVLVLADRAEALSAWDSLLDYAHERGSIGSKAATSVFRGYTLYRHGELADAEASLRDALEELTLWGLGREGRLETAAWLAGVLRERGDLAGARRELEFVREPGDASPGARPPGRSGSPPRPARGGAVARRRGRRGGPALGRALNRGAGAADPRHCGAHRRDRASAGSRGARGALSGAPGARQGAA